MSITEILFWFLSAMALGGALMMVTSKNPVYSVLWLIVVFFAISGHYILLNAQFLAIVNIIVYAGAIMVLFLFVIMLVNIERASKERRFNSIWPVGLAAACALMALFVSAFVKGRALFPDRMMTLPESSNTQQIATMLYGEVGPKGQYSIGQYTLAFEIASLLLLVAILGAVIMTKKKI